ncbi:MAG TPA: type I-E CRISPR-associated protein Cas7/Cse4/CasC [Kiritimatiellia bacterium]|nr:type I-E CRISPR-associated protein Cas7/Cse4/CasC [Kiritimatiellia bacterium]
MNMIELHMLHSFPVTCLNRDDLGAPKSAVFGGVTRARVSSQSWKRAIREMAAQDDQAGHFFAGQRTRYVVTALKECFSAKGADEKKAMTLARLTADAVGKLDSLEKGNVKTLLFFSPEELAAVVDAVWALNLDDKLLAAAESSEKKEKDKAEKELAKSISKATKALATAVKDAADIAIFGRMVADDHTLTLEGAGLFSHALSTHSASNELDFFSAVDDAKKDAEDAGAGHIGTIEFNSACYYRYVGINLDLLFNDEDHLKHFTAEERKEVIKAFLRAAIMAVPKARKNSMFGFNPPAYVLGVRRAGQPISLVNAFEKPVAADKDGYVKPSEAALKTHWAKLKELYCLKTEVESELPPDNLDTLIDKLLENLA